MKDEYDFSDLKVVRRGPLVPRISKEDREIFLETFRILSAFEAETRLIRGHGAFTEEEVSQLVPVIKKVLKWIEDEN